MSHHRCCCGGEPPAFDEFIPCIEVTPNISTRGFCHLVIDDPTGDPCYAGVPITYDRELTAFAGLNQPHKLQMVSGVPGSPPFGTYSYSATVSILVNERSTEHSFAQVPGAGPLVCAVFITGDQYYRHTATISCVVDYVSGVQPKVRLLRIDILTDLRHEFHIYHDGALHDEGESWTTGLPFKLYQQDGGTAKNFGTTIPNTVPLRTDCSLADNTLIGGGSAKVVRLADDSVCTPYPLTHRFYACGYLFQPTPGGQPDFIYVDLNTRPTGASISDKTQVEYLGWLYNITDFRSVIEVPVSVTWTNDRCFPTMIKCDDSGSPLPYDPLFQTSYHHTAYIGVDQYKRHTAFLLGPAAAFRFSSDFCPSGGAGVTLLLGTGRFGSDAMLDATGHNPEQEAKIANSGGGCGCDPPRPLD